MGRHYVTRALPSSPSYSRHPSATRSPSPMSPAHPPPTSTSNTSATGPTASGRRGRHTTTRSAATQPAILDDHTGSFARSTAHGRVRGPPVGRAPGAGGSTARGRTRVPECFATCLRSLTSRWFGRLGSLLNRQVLRSTHVSVRLSIHGSHDGTYDSRTIAGSPA